jgi:cytochrome c-type biogenesis protein CcmH/NrfG
MEKWLAGSCFAVLLTFFAAPASWAQKTGPTPPSPPSTQPPGNPPLRPTSPPQVSPFRAPIFVFGRILMDDGHPVPEPVSVELRCGLDLIQAVRANLDGHFHFTLGEGPQNNAALNASDETPMTIEAANVGAPVSSAGPAFRLSFCELQVSVSGYQPVSKIVRLDAHEAGGIDAGTMVLTRIAGIKGSAISVTSLLAPHNARKEFEKGYKDALQHRSSSATRHLQKAVAEYDNYAVAWEELGKIYLQNHQNEEARQAFAKAIFADPQYLPPCLALAGLEMQSQHYEDAIEAAGKALKLYPGLAIARLIQADANFRLNRLDAAEKIARDVANDSHQELPQLHVLLANIDLKKQDYSDAAIEFQAYLKQSPKGDLAMEVRSRLKELQEFEANTRKTASIPESPQPRVESASLASVRTGTGTLRIYLRMDDDSPFIGLASVHVAFADGREILGSTGADGEFSFASLPPGNYNVEVNAPGFVAILRRVEVDAGSQTKTAFLIMKPQVAPPAAIRSGLPLSSDGLPPTAGPGALLLTPAVAGDAATEVVSGVACPLTTVLDGAGRRVAEFVETLQKFDATEHVANVIVNASGARLDPEQRKFDYVVNINRSKSGAFLLDEYRNGSTSPAQFPAGVATMGLPALALVLHPSMVSDFKFSCDGLAHWSGHPAWLVRFEQRADRPNRIRNYVVANQTYPVPLKGRIWIDAGTYQVWHLETELMKPIPQILLTQEFTAIDYGPVRFHRNTKQLWLPLDAKVYWERRGIRMYRRHTFSNFKLFEVASAQQIDNPGESYCFTNTSPRDVSGTLNVVPVSGVSARPVSIPVTIGTGHRACKPVGSGKEINIPVNDIDTAAFVYKGPAGSITVDAILPKETTVELVPED